MNISARNRNFRNNLSEDKIKPAVSVIIPTYNRAEYIPDAIASVIKQTFPVTEILIINDGSSPAARKTLQDIAIHHSCVSLYNLPGNKGVAHARNFALKIATGDYILFLDDDDWLHPHMIEYAIQPLEKDTALTGVFCFYDYDSGVFTFPPSLTWKRLLNYKRLKDASASFQPAECFTNKHLKKDTVYTFLRSTIAIHSCLLRRAAIGNARFHESLVFGEDKYFWLSLALNGGKFHVIKKTLCTVHRHLSNNSKYSYINEKKQQSVFYETLVREKMLPCRKSKAFIFLKLIHVRFVLGQPQRTNELAAIIMTPEIISKELFLFIKRRIMLRWHFIRYCLQKKQLQPDS